MVPDKEAKKEYEQVSFVSNGKHTNKVHTYKMYIITKLACSTVYLSITSGSKPSYDNSVNIPFIKPIDTDNRWVINLTGYNSKVTFLERILTLHTDSLKQKIRKKI